MAFDTAANIISDAAIQLGLVAASISDPYASTDDNILRLNASLKQLGQDLLREYEWSHLVEEHTFATVASTQSYALPAGFARILNGTAWNRSSNDRLVGPLNGQQWQALQASSVASVDDAFRIWQDLFFLYPTPSGVETIAYEYVSKLWVESTGNGTPDKEHPTVSTDVLWLDRALLVWGLRLYFRRDAGLPHDVDAEAFGRTLARVRGGDGASPMLGLSRQFAGVASHTVPETGFGS